MKFDEDRLNHSVSVARKMVEIAKKMGLNEASQKELFILGFNHDIGYEYDENDEHGKVGGKMLRQSGYKYWKEIYYHGDIHPEYSSLYLDILNSADMQVDKFGNDIGYEGRLSDIRSRYGEQSEVYKKCEVLVSLLKQKFNKEIEDVERD